jgi:hypothetical protein
LTTLSYIVARVRDEQHRQAESWLQSHAEHRVWEVIEDPTRLQRRWDCLSCDLTLRVTTVLSHDYMNNAHSITVASREDKLGA